MADDYWKNYGQDLEKKKESARNSGKRYCKECGALCGSNEPCPDCSVIECKRCKEKFLNHGNRKICPDCVGERSENRDPLPGTRLGGLSDGKP